MQRVCEARDELSPYPTIGLGMPLSAIAFMAISAADTVP
jgi:hypothetical protein